MTSTQAKVDVVVVGAGMGGAAFCRQLIRRAPHLRVLCLERGPWPDPRAFPAQTPGWQAAGFGAWSANPSLRRAAGGNPFCPDEPVDDSRSDFKPLFWNGVGGSTVQWAAHFPRLHPSDFRVRTDDGVAEDWPFTYDDLLPWFDLNDAEMGVAGLAGDPAYPPKPERAMPPLPLGRLGERAARGFDALGWHWWPVDAAVNSRPHAGRPACNHCGPCLAGCVSGAKASTDLTYWPRAIAAGVELRTGCTVTAVEVTGGLARGVHYRDATGREVFQPAAAVVLAGNGIGTAAILLRSGLGGPAAGRHLMFHGAAYARGLFADELDGPVGPVGCAIYSHQFYETDLARGFLRGVQLQVTRENAPLAQASRLVPAWGEAAQRALRREFRHSMAVLVMNEDLPEWSNRVEAAPDGITLHYRMSDNTRRALDFGLDRAEELLRACGAVEVVRVPLAPMTGWHLLGTARMGAEPATSVTDGRGRLHGAPNLLVADGSLFPTVGAVNPASTIGAVALMLADRLAGELA